jgi:hypothetical protein
MNKDFLKGFKKGTHAFGDTIAVIVNSALLAMVYLIGVGLTALGCKLFKKQFLDLKPDPKAKSYWSELNLKKRKIEEHYRQF